MLALVISAVLAGQPIDQAPKANAPGWAFVSYSGDLNTEVLVHQAPTPQGSPYRYLWVRYEFDKTTGLAKPPGAPRPPRSEVVYAEVNCLNQTSRALQITDYMSSNLSGTMFQTTPPAPEWFAAKPHTFAEEIDPIACRAGEDPITDIMLGSARG